MIKSLTGNIGEPAKIHVNNKIANFNTSLQDGDIIEITKGTKGDKKAPYLYDCISREKSIY